MTNAQEKKKNVRTLVGAVVSASMDKTIVVSVEHRLQHKVYGKFLRRSNKLYAHDEQNTSGVGDKVIIKESRPLSKHKKWALVEVVEKAQ
jgi:small subunit ribosomal protein S17